MGTMSEDENVLVVGCLWFREFVFISCVGPSQNSLLIFNHISTFYTRAWTSDRTMQESHFIKKRNRRSAFNMHQQSSLASRTTTATLINETKHTNPPPAQLSSTRTHFHEPEQSFDITSF